MAEARRNLYLVDGSGYIFRAFFALPQLNNSRGLPTNATYGFIRMFLKLLKDARPTHIGVVFDSPKKTFRDDLFESYKANRVVTPNDLLKQIPYIYRAVDAFRIPKVVFDGYEADDVIGTLAVRAASDKFNCVIVTGDKDFMQLVGPNITLWDTMRDKRTAVREVRERFGVEPRALVDVMALMGDAIDNVKGVPGVGEKTASGLIQHFGSLEALFNGLDRLEETKIRGARKLATTIAEHRGDVELARKLVRIDTEVELPLGPDQLEWQGIDHESVAELLRELEFGSLAAELTPTQNAAAITATPAEEIRLDRESIGAAIAELAQASHIAIDFDPGVSAENGEQATLDSYRNSGSSAVLRLKADGDSRIFALGTDLIGECSSILAAPSPSKSCHDLKHHIHLLRRHGLETNGVDFDTMLGGFLVNPGKSEPTLDSLYHEHLAPLGGVAAITTGPALIEALRTALMRKLEADELLKLFHEIEIPTARVLAEMEEVGIGADAKALKVIAAEFGEELNRLERECFELAGREFNLNSPIQLREILFNELKLSSKGLKKTKSGFSTDADALEKLAVVHPLPRKLLEYRAIAKLKSTYADALQALLDPATGRIHTSFHQALTATGRLSSTDPNLQNIPTRTEEGRRIRRAFVPAAGYVLLSADYSQIELRILAHLSGDATLIDAFSRGEDIHARTAAEVLGVMPGTIDAEARRLAKVINFGIIYGMGPQRLASELGIPMTQASDYIKRYFERLPGVRSLIDETLRQARERGYVATMYGRRRYLPELSGPDGGARAQAERIAVNTPIQGSAADLIKLAMVRLHAKLAERQVPARIVLQVHDELLLEVREAALTAAIAIVRREMEGVAKLKVPLVIEAKAGPNWAELARL